MSKMEVSTTVASLNVRDVALNPTHANYRDFENYLRGLCSEEHLDFLRDVSAYCAQVRAGKDIDALFPVAKRICDVYLTQGTTREINVDNTTRIETVAAVQARRLDIDTFERATDKVVKMLSAPDCFPKFVANMKRARERASASGPSGSVSRSTSSSTLPLAQLAETPKGGRGGTLPRSVHKSQSTGALDPKIAEMMNLTPRKRRSEVPPPVAIGTKSPGSTHATPTGNAFISFVMDFEAPENKPPKEEKRRSLTRSLLNLRSTFMSTSQTSITTTNSQASHAMGGDGSMLDNCSRNGNAEDFATDGQRGHFQFESESRGKPSHGRAGETPPSSRFPRPASSMAWKETMSNCSQDDVGGADTREGEMSLLDFLTDDTVEPTATAPARAPGAGRPPLVRQLSNGSIRSRQSTSSAQHSPTAHTPNRSRSTGTRPSDHRLSLQRIEDLVSRRRGELKTQGGRSASPSPGTSPAPISIRKSTSAPVLPTPEVSLLEFLTEDPPAGPAPVVRKAQTAPNTPEHRISRKRRDSQLKVAQMARLSITEETDKEMSLLDFLNDPLETVPGSAANTPGVAVRADQPAKARTSTNGIMSFVKRTSRAA